MQNIWDKVCGYWVLGEQIGNIISDCWALGENMKEPYGIQLGTPNSLLKKIPFFNINLKIFLPKEKVCYLSMSLVTFFPPNNL